MKRITLITVLLSLVLVASTSPGVADSAYKVPTANPSFTRGSLVSGSFLNVQTNDNTYMRVRESAVLFFFYFFDSTWASWQSFTEASRSKLVDIQIELVGYQSDTAESWYVQFYNYNTSAWDSTWYALGSLPTSPKGTRQVAVGSAARARTFVSAAGAFRLRLADAGTAGGSWETTQTNLYIDLLRAQFLYDVTPPVSSVTAPTNGEQTRAHSYTITGTSSDPAPDASGVTAVDVSVDGGTSWNPAVPSAPGNYSTWSYAWNPIPGEGTYNIRSRARDDAGNVETPGPGVNLIVDWTPPVVAGTSPANGQTNVAVTAVMQATFTEANGMKASTIDSSTFLVKKGGVGVAGSVSYDPGSKTAHFDPTGDLSYGTFYTATLTTGITDQAGNPLASDYTWTFTTAPVPPPYILAGDSGWQKVGTWKVEKYTQLPEPYKGPVDLLVANDAGATATYTIPAGYARLEVASSKYWTSGIVEVYLDSSVPVATVNLNSETTTWGQVIYTNEGLDPGVAHTLTIRAMGSGGPGGDLWFLHFVNVQWLRYW